MKGLYVLKACMGRLFNLCNRYKNYMKLRACVICVGRHCVIHGHVGLNIDPSAKVLNCTPKVRHKTFGVHYV